MLADHCLLISHSYRCFASSNANLNGVGLFLAFGFVGKQLGGRHGMVFGSHQSPASKEKFGSNAFGSPQPSATKEKLVSNAFGSHQSPASKQKLTSNALASGMPSELKYAWLPM